VIKALLISSLAMNLGLLLGRLSGFVREAFVASTYGATSQADTVVLMLTVPDLLVNILVGGAMGAMLVPEFTQRPKIARQLLYQSLLFFGVLFLMVAVGFYWQTDVLVAMLAPGFTNVQSEHVVVALRWVLWLIPLTILAGVVTAYLHAQHKFAVAAMGTLIINSAIIIGLVLVYYGFGSLSLVAVFVIVGGLLRLLSQLSLVHFHWSPLVSLKPWQLHRPLVVRYGQAMMSGSLLLLFPVIARALASYEGEGSIAMFNYSMRLIEFPLAIAVTF
jgi:putative peptidoglycan lipid II flippase